MRLHGALYVRRSPTPILGWTWRAQREGWLSSSWLAVMPEVTLLSTDYAVATVDYFETWVRSDPGTRPRSGSTTARVTQFRVRLWVLAALAALPAIVQLIRRRRRSR